MKRIISGAFALFLFVAVASPSTVVAQQEAEVLEETSSSPTASDTSRADRIQKYKEKSEERLSALKARKLVAVCKSAQGKVASAQFQYNSVVKKRTATYDNVTNRLNNLVEKLQKAAVDTTLLEASILEFDGFATTAVASLEQYDQMISDLVEMDCEADPEGFQAALTAARMQRSEAITQSKALKSYAQEQIKPILQDIRIELEDRKDNNNEDTDNQISQ